MFLNMVGCSFRILTWCVAAGSILFMDSCQNTNPVGNSHFVDPFIGTGGHGHTFPGAQLPFGMVQVSPDTRLEGWDGCSGYHYSDSIIYGFSHTHLSGTGCSDYGDILLMPTTGPVLVDNGSLTNGIGYRSVFRHTSEKASPGFYSVRLDKYDILAELTATRRTGIHRYTFPDTNQANIILDLEHRDKVLNSYIKIISDTEIEGYRISRAWADSQVVFFVIRFSQPFINYGLVKDGSVIVDSASVAGTSVKAYFNFNTALNSPVVVKTGISSVDISGARNNLDTECPGWNFDDIAENAVAEWDKVLNRISVTGDENAKIAFYTSLYHTYLSPVLFSDADGRYRGRDHKVHQATHDVYSVFSLWDTYRGLHPLMTILEPEETNDFIKTFILQYQQGGRLPVWELSACETNCMIGYHSVPVIWDAYAKGIRDYKADSALVAMLGSAHADNAGINALSTEGYISSDVEGESVSKTLEYAYDDWCIAMLAKELKKEEVYREFIIRAQAWKHVFDDSTKFMRARMNGSWFTPFRPSEVNSNYTEANSWQYSFYVPQDINSLIEFMGGEEAFAARLDSLFSSSSETTGRQQADITGLIGQYAHGNEPSHHMAYLYCFAGQPWKTQALIDRILNEMYTTDPDGLCGNEDCGQMSAWYVLSAMGFYPVTPGTNTYIIGCPRFRSMSIDLGNGKKFTIKAELRSEKNVFIQGARLNGKPLNRSWILHEEIMNGGTLEFDMGSEPSFTWATGKEARPQTRITDHLVVPAPYIKGGKMAFRGSHVVELSSANPCDKIYYTTDESKPDTGSTLYEKPFTIDHSVILMAVALSPEGYFSPVIRSSLRKVDPLRSIRLISQFNSQYPAGGELALIDGIRGGADFRTGTWQGFYDCDMEVIVDLGRKTVVKKLGIGVLQDAGSWIFFPPEVSFYQSSDGKKYELIAVVKNTVPQNKFGGLTMDMIPETEPFTTRYIKIVATYPGHCPAWHPGAGYPSHIFADEIIIE